MCRYSPKIDLAFRKLFGSEENKDILLSFVNAILENDIKIKDLTIKNPYNLSDYMNGKTSILDIKAVDENGIWYDIEMQVGEQGHYGKRALYYWGKVYTEQIKKAEQFYDLSKTIGIHLLDFDFFGDERYKRRIVLKDFETDERYKELDYEELYFIEFCKFKKEYGELKTVLDRWITFMNKAYEYEKNDIPKEMKQEKEIIEAIKKLDLMYFDKKERELYDGEMKYKMIVFEELRTAKEVGEKEGRKKGIKEGREEGREEGIKRGRKEKDLEVATKSIEQGIEVSVITLITNLTIEEVEELKEKIKLEG